jgi:hypothetical protein
MQFRRATGLVVLTVADARFNYPRTVEAMGLLQSIRNEGVRGNSNGGAELIGTPEQCAEWTRGLARCIVSWEGIVDEAGAPVPCTPENMMALMQGRPDLPNALLWASVKAYFDEIERASAEVGPDPQSDSDGQAPQSPG